MKELPARDYKIINIDDKKVILNVPSMSLMISKSLEADYQFIEEKMKNQVNVNNKNSNMKNNASDILTGLILNTTETCNLSCDYCMVTKGTYHNDLKKKHLFFDDYKNIFNFVLDNYSLGTSFVCFFGGEPLLRINEIKGAIVELYKMYDAKKLKYPRCSIISNGVLLSDGIFEFLNKYNIYLSVSIDGIEEFHDSARVFPNGQGSYNIIKHNLLSFKNKKRNFPLYAEATIHRKHIEYGIEDKRKSGYNFVKNLYDLGFDSVYVFPVDSEDKALSLDDPLIHNKVEQFFYGVYDFYMELMEQENIGYYPPAHFIGVFSNIFMKRANRSCNVGKSTLFVNPQGELYPCHLIYNSKIMKLGTLEAGFNGKHIKNQQKIKNRYEINQCSNCNNRNLCFLWCPGSSMLSNGKFMSVVPTRCKIVDITVNYVLKSIYELINNVNNYERFKTNLIKVSKYYKP